MPIFVSTTTITLVCITTIITLVCITKLPKFAPEMPKRDGLATYIVHVEGGESEDLERWHRSFLPASSGDEDFIYAYRHVLKGFAARLTADEARDMEEKEGVLAVWPEEILSVQTTRSPAFLGLYNDTGVWKDSKYGEGVIIGVLDTGIFPYHPSFNDTNMPDRPREWMDRCGFLSPNACNKKLIGARNFVKNESGRLPIDATGHGTHCAGTAAGNFVPDATFYGQANGIAAGVAPLARLAIYKVCSKDGCNKTHVLEGMDRAIDDGVHVLSISIARSYYPFITNEYISTAAYNAVKKGIFVSCAAGNHGPWLGSVDNGAPWVLTVGASTIDRELRAVAVLGNGEEVFGEANFQPSNLEKKPFPLIYGGLCNETKGINASGKIVACDNNNIDEEEVKKTKATAFIMMNPECMGVTKNLPSVPFIPMMQVNYTEGERIKQYISSTKPSDSTARLSFHGTVTGTCGSEGDCAPTVASFSSRGPNVQSWGILKPDILGPGVNILAANISSEDRYRFTFKSGTSMACPHLSGVAALLKKKNPGWSPAVIKSAIMTTADVVNRAGNPIQDQTLGPADLFATGAGQVNVSRASNPGLVYNISAQDYIPYLCGLNYTSTDINTITQEKVNCSEVSSIHESQLNYPSFSILFGSNVQTYSRRVTNVGVAISSYDVHVAAPAGVAVDVTPARLHFTSLNQTLPYNVTFSRLRDGVKVNYSQGSLADGVKFNYSQGSLTWISTTTTRYEVRSPIVAIIYV